MSASTLLDRAVPAPTLHLVGGADPQSVHPDQLTLPFVWEVSDGVPSVPPLPRHLRLVGEAATIDPTQGGQPPGQPVGEQTPLTPAWVARIARAIIEVADGDRPASQLARWVDRAPLAELQARGVAYRRHPAVRNRRGELSAMRAIQQVRAVRLCPVQPSAVEASAVLIGGGRGRALALRLEARGPNWIVAAVALG